MELWSLLNFMMPHIFRDSDDFDSWFNFDSSKQTKKTSDEARFMIIQILHRILKPFMLRRTKDERATKLPEKLEINISVGLTPLQMRMYKN